MNLEEALREAARALQSEYRDYNVIGARQDLEDRIISAEMSEVTYSHPSAQPLTESATPVSDPQSPQQSDSWETRAACRKMHPNRMFVQGAAQHEAKIICHACPVRVNCLANALDYRIEFGVWGGMTERERRALLRQRPEVRSWGELLGNAQSVWNENNTIASNGRNDIIAG